MIKTGGDWRLRETLQSTGLAVLAGAICVMPRVVPWVLCLLALLYAVPRLDRARRHAVQAVTGMAPLATLLVPGLGVLSTLWSVSARDSFDAAITALGLAFVALYLIAAIGRQLPGLSPVWRRRFVRAMPAGGIAGLAFLAAETLTGNGITRRALTTFPVLTGERGKGVRIEAGQVAEIAGFFMNRNVAGLALIAIPVLLGAWIWLPQPRRKPIVAAMLACLFLVVFASDSETAKLALVAGAAIVALAHRWPTGTAVGLGATLAVGLLFTISLARLPLLLGLHEASWLPYSHRDRVLIWDANAEIARSHPVLGAGVEAGKFLQLEYLRQRDATKAGATPTPQTETRQVAARRPAWHAHNFYLQTRLELGLVGSIAALVFGLVMIAAAARLDARLVPWGLGLIAATMATAISGWGMWQPWFVAGLGASTVFLNLLATYMALDQRSAPGEGGSAPVS